MGAIPILYNIYNETRRTTGVQGSLTPPFAVSGTRLRKAPPYEVLSSAAKHLMHRTLSDGGAACSLPPNQNHTKADYQKEND